MLRLRVGVIGAGTAGTAAAALLSRQGHDVSLYEKTPALHFSVEGSEIVGAGIGVQPIGLTVLSKIGDDALQAVLDRGARIDRLHSITQSGKTVLDLAYSDFRKELFGVGLHRDVLFRVLMKKAEEEGVRVVPDFCVEDVSGSFINDEGPFDLVVVADGRDSIRKNMRDVKSVEVPYKFGCLWTILEDTTGEFTTSNTLYQRLNSAKVMLGLLPTGRTMDAPKDSPPLVSLFWSLDMDTLGAVRERGVDAWKQTVIELEPRTEKLLEQLTSMDQLIPAAYSDTFMPKYFTSSASSNTVFLGDAAHATSPQLGQGANLALVDAWTLSECIAHASPGMSVAPLNHIVGSALKEYDRRRRWRLRFNQFNSKMLTPVFQSNSAIVGALRDALLGPLCTFPPTRLQMLTTLCGAQTNGIPWTTIPEDEFMGHIKKQR